MGGALSKALYSWFDDCIALRGSDVTHQTNRSRFFIATHSTLSLTGFKRSASKMFLNDFVINLEP